MSIIRKTIRKIFSEASYASGRYFVQPEFVSLLLTLRCNFRCASCSVWKLPREQNPLTEKEWLAIADDLAHSLHPDTFIEINGGEALLEHSLVISVIRRLKKHFTRVTLNSNGSLFTEQRIRELEMAGLDTVKLSLYSEDKKIHDELRGHQGAYENARVAMRLIEKSALSLEVGILITSKNIRLIPELARSLSKEKRIIILQPLDESIEGIASKNTEKNEFPENLWPSRKDSRSFFHWAKKNANLFKNSPSAIETMRKYYLNPSSILKYRCFSGQRTLIVYPNGNVTLCFKRSAIGNIRKSRIETLLKSRTAQKERNGITQCRKYCRVVGCNFSRGFSEIFRDFFQK